MSLAPRELKHDTVTILVGAHTVKLLGILAEADFRAWFIPLLLEVHRAAVATSMPEVVFDIRHLSYANAGLWRSMLLWLRLLRGDGGGAYRLRLLSDPVHRWQKMGIPPFQAFGDDRLVVR